MSKETVRRVAIKNNSVCIDGTQIVASIFSAVPASGPIEPYQARAMATVMQNIVGELTRAAGSVERQRVEAAGGSVPEDTEPGAIEAAGGVVREIINETRRTYGSATSGRELPAVRDPLTTTAGSATSGNGGLPAVNLDTTLTGLEGIKPMRAAFASVFGRRFGGDE